jgi:hypothetical protein
LLFCLTIHPLLQACKSPLRIAYKDDITLGGPSATVADDVTMIKKEGAPRGLFLNDTKCEAISITGHSTDDALQQFVQLTPLIIGAAWSSII